MIAQTNQGLIAYDCVDTSVNITLFSLVDVEPCTHDVMNITTESLLTYKSFKLRRFMTSTYINARSFSREESSIVECILILQHTRSHIDISSENFRQKSAEEFTRQDLSKSIMKFMCMNYPRITQEAVKQLLSDK